MHDTREEVIKALLKSYEFYYNINQFEHHQSPLEARCDYFEHSEKYVVSKRASLWTADREEFLYILNVPHLTCEIFETWKDYVYEDGMTRIHVGPGHMSSFITAVFVCDTCDKEALKALKKCRIYKSFHFSLYGWMDFHALAVNLSQEKIESNRGGSNTAKFLKKILYRKHRREKK